MQWQMDGSHTSTTFSVKHMMIATVRGHFDKVTGTAEIEDGKVRSAAMEIDASSINTREPKRDAHLRSADFFDVEHHPHLRFQTTGIEPVSGDNYRVTGDLTMHGVTRPVTLSATVTPTIKDYTGAQRIGVSATGEIDRKEFGLNWNVALEAGGVLVSEKVRIEIDTEFVQPQ